MSEEIDNLNNNSICEIQSEFDAKTYSIDGFEKQTKSLSNPIVKQNFEISGVVKPISIPSIIPTIFQYSGKIGTTYLKALDFSSTLASKFITPLSTGLSRLQTSYDIIDKINLWNISLQNYSNLAINKIYNSLVRLTDTILSPALEWLNSIDFTPIQSILSKIHLETEYWDKYKELNKAYLNAMYECKWFPYAGWTVNYELFVEVTDILSTSRQGSARREKRIDKAIISYYTKQEIKNIKRSWNRSDLKPYIKKMLGQAIEAHLRGEYALTVTCLATMWEGLIRDKLNVTRICQKKALAELKELSIENSFEAIYSDFYSNLILCDCSSPEDVIEGVPNRNGIGHSQYKKYPNKKSSLNAILITDFLIHLKPKNILEEDKNSNIENT